LTPNLDCSNTEIVAQNDLVIEHITSGSADPTEIVFDEFQDLAAVSEGNASLCGPRAYSLAINTIDVTLDEASRTIKVQFQSDDHVAANQDFVLDLTVELVDSGITFV